MRRLIIGGTFNPVHIGHLRLAIEVREALAFDQVEWIPCFLPRHKSQVGLLPFSLRVAMVQAAIGNETCTRVNDIESRLPTPSYTFQTLKALVADDPASERYFVLGHREFLRLPNWHCGRDVISLAHIVVAARAGYDPDHFAQQVAALWPGCHRITSRDGTSTAYELAPGRQAIVVSPPQIDISSSMIRERWLARRSVNHLVPPSVHDLLSAHRAQVESVWRQAAGPDQREPTTKVRK